MQNFNCTHSPIAYISFPLQTIRKNNLRIERPTTTLSTTFRRRKKMKIRLEYINNLSKCPIKFKLCYLPLVSLMNVKKN